MRTLKLILLILIGLICISACNAPGQDTDDELDKEIIECVPPARLEIQPWGKSGSSKSCKILNGPFVAAENGYVHLRGQYEGGREAGTWRWYDRSGNVVKTIDYSKLGQAAN
ncbi:MAG TPA: hypothetical protein VK364_06665 [Hymenobacter sp.]|nr:hypothetical protein [Hymenobacter sp.]